MNEEQVIDLVKLRSILKFQGRKNMWLSLILRVTPETFSLWLSGKRDFPSEYIAPTAIALGVPIRMLVK